MTRPARGAFRDLPRGIVTVVVATAVALGAVLVLAGCISQPGRADTRPHHLPLGVSLHAVADCEASAGLGGSAAVTQIWRDADGIHVRIAAGTQPQVAGPPSATVLALTSCLTLAAGVQEGYPSDSAGLLLLWKYSTTTLWPCFAEHGVDIGPVPSRSTFLTSDPLRIDPFNLIRIPVSDELLTQLRTDCPPVPAYLKSGAAGSVTG